MRGVVIGTLTELAEQDPRIVLLTADLGYCVLEQFADRVPGQFFNVGVSEQNMLGLATGLAESGFIPFVYSIVNFAALRPYEFIRNGPVLHQLPVRILAIGGGFEYGHAGPTHHGLEDIGVMRVQPGLTVIAPADAQQAKSALKASYHLPGPVYFRLGKDDKTVLPGLEGKFDLGKAQEIRKGNDLLMVTMGSIAPSALEAINTLSEKGISCGLMVVSCLSPAPKDDLVEILARYPLVLTVEAHYIVGGVGSLVSEIIAEEGISCKVFRCGVRSTPNGITGSEKFLNDVNGLSSEKLVATALQALGSF
ncbi:MAG: 1-deoxy-D-xylulose-5-phosphate synthase [Nitrospinae bacterium CG11_big_fil_rev_8_21_14_0_20_45_15]|nr:MAG: 1-deoxy-D-xylulose-5-phosphate synthase [Nitrospinae bacterium CG11_big_fil_rev_8_21_14_0_20_45_15]